MAVIRTIGVPLLALIALMSLIGMSLAAALVAHYDVWIGDTAGWTKSLLSLFVMSLAASIAFLVGLIVAAGLFGNTLLNLAVWGFLWTLAFISCIGIDVTLDANNCSVIRCNLFGVCRSRRARCGTFATMEAFAWMTWILLSAYLINLGYSAWSERKNGRLTYGGPAPVMSQPAGMRGV